MKRITWAFGIVMLLCGSLPAAEKVRVSVAGGYTMIFLSAGVAQKKGFFKEEGLDADIIVMSPPTSIAALTNGDIDYTMLTGSVIRAAIRGLPVRVVAGFVNSSPHALLARPEIKSVRELKGKTLAVGAYGDATYVLGRMIIKHFNIDPEKEIQTIAVGSDSARLAALQKGLADVVVSSPPWDFEGKKMGYTVLARAYEFFNYPLSGLGVHVRRIKENPGQIKRVIKALIRAGRFIHQNREETIRVLVEWGRVGTEHALASYDSSVKVVGTDGSIPMDGLRLLIDQAARETKITREVSPNEVADFALLNEAQRELGIKR